MKKVRIEYVVFTGADSCSLVLFFGHCQIVDTAAKRLRNELAEHGMDTIMTGFFGY